MNTIAFSRLLARDLIVEDRASLPADAALDVVAAINAGLSQFFAKAPSRLKRTTISATLRAAETLAVVFTAQYSRTITTPAFNSDMRGCTVQFGTTPLLNEVVNENTVLDEYLSPTLSAQATVYHDVVPLEDVVERATSSVRLYGVTTFEPKILHRDDQLHDRKHYQWMAGEPCYYTIDPVGSSQGSEPETLLRVWPMPTTDYVVRFEAEISAKRIEFSHLINAIELPLADTLVEDILLPLCSDHLTKSPFWKDKTIIAKTREDAALAVGKISLIANDYAMPCNQVGTQNGF